MDFTPDDTRPTGQRASSCRSAEISKAGKELKDVQIRVAEGAYSFLLHDGRHLA